MNGVSTDIVLFEDNPICRSSLEVAIRSFGYKYLSTDKPEEVLGLLKVARPRMLLFTLDSLVTDLSSFWSLEHSDAENLHFVAIGSKQTLSKFAKPPYIHTLLSRPLGLDSLRKLLQDLLGEKLLEVAGS